MIKLEHIEVMGFEHAIRGMRNPMNSWTKSDSYSYISQFDETVCRYESGEPKFYIGENDLKLMKNLIKAGTDHRKFMRMITVYMDITAPLYWWKEFDTYKVGTVANSCSTMHKIADKEFELSDFSCEHLLDDSSDVFVMDEEDYIPLSPTEVFQGYIIDMLNSARARYLETKEKKY